MKFTYSYSIHTKKTMFLSPGNVMVLDTRRYYIYYLLSTPLNRLGHGILGNCVHFQQLQAPNVKMAMQGSYINIIK